ncbi:MAG: tetratricopeptide repeat protein [Elusimicrobia bacterium]|nr:tetratricopeptide repeat protein [Elusimicrobiota bacterium]MBP9698602.1 tetratricopeptide repeat protein [Elusimicrobiota bacterium]
MLKKIMMGVLMLIVTGGWRVQAQEGPAPATVQFTPPIAVVEPDPQLIAAREQLAQGKKREAKKTAKKFLGENETSAEGWTVLGDIYASLGSSGKAKGRYKKALKFDSHYGPAYVGLGQLFEKAGRLDEAANEYRAAAVVSPNDPVVQQALARVAGSGPTNE